jgi:hypothetical protein
MAAMRGLRKGEIAVPALELLELVALWPGVDPEAGTRCKTARDEAILSTTLGKASTIDASTVTIRGGCTVLPGEIRFW